MLVFSMNKIELLHGDIILNLYLHGRCNRFLILYQIVPWFAIVHLRLVEGIPAITVLSKTSLIVPTKLNYEILNPKIGWKALHKLYISESDISTTLVEVVSKLIKVQSKTSLKTKWHQISMESFHFPEQRFPRICLNCLSSHCLFNTLSLLFFHSTYF